MFIYNNNNNNHQKLKTDKHIDRKASIKKSVKVRTSSKRKTNKRGKSLHKANTQFLKTLGFVVRKRQK